MRPTFCFWAVLLLIHAELQAVHSIHCYECNGEECSVPQSNMKTVDCGDGVCIFGRNYWVTSERPWKDDSRGCESRPDYISDYPHCLRGDPQIECYCDTELCNDDKHPPCKFLPTIGRGAGEVLSEKCPKEYQEWQDYDAEKKADCRKNATRIAMGDCDCYMAYCDS